jgi:hypothetical protein
MNFSRPGMKSRAAVVLISEGLLALPDFERRMT